MKSRRALAREFVLQGLYQWLLSGNDFAAIVVQLEQLNGFERADADYCRELLKRSMDGAEEMAERLQEYLDRPYREVSPIERGILVLASTELAQYPELPFRVVISEAIELAKRYGGTDGHKYVNGVLDKLAAELRPHERGGSRA